MTLHYSNLNDLADISSSPQIAIPQPAKPHGFYRDGLKRALDIFLTILIAPVALLLIAVMALIVSSEGGKPFYSQIRIGRDGRRYRMWKLRTMVPNADQRLADYLETDCEARREWDATQKLKCDPRITAVGRFLRKSSIDELPQLWNVLNGTMSLVGPRPIMVHQQAFYFGEGYYNLRPGITGFWQISDRNECNFTGRVQYDDAYDRDVSLKTDVTVLARTVGVVLRCTGY